MKSPKVKLSFIASPDSPRFGDAEATNIAEELLTIENQYGGVTPQTVLAVAKSPKHRLHKYFTWDNTEAAEKYRVWEARRLIASVYVQLADSEDSVPVRAFVNVKSSVIQTDDDDEEIETVQNYVSLPKTLGRTDYQSHVLNYAAMQLKGWRRRFGALKQFFEITEVIDRTLK